MTLVRVEHARSIAGRDSDGYCVPGMQKFFERHSLDFRDFVRNGIDSEKLIATGDAMALMVVEAAEKAKNG